MTELTDTQLTIVKDAVRDIVTRQPRAKEFYEDALAKLKRGALDELAGRGIALALQGVAMYEGPEKWPAVLRVADALEIGEYLSEYLQSWIAYGGRSLERDDELLPSTD